MTERKTVEGAYRKIENHERDCALRYQSLENNISSVGDQVRDLKDTVKGAQRGAWAMATGLIIWLALQLYAGLQKVEAPSASHVPAPAVSTIR